MTSEKAIEEIQKMKSYGIDDIKNVLDKVDIIDTYASEDALTVLYSGEEAIKQFRADDSRYRIIDRTEAAKFLNSRSFKSIIKKAIYNDYGNINDTEYKKY